MRRFDPDDANTKGKSLYDLQLAPASVFYILFADQTLNGAFARRLSLGLFKAQSSRRSFKTTTASTRAARHGRGHPCATHFRREGRQARTAKGWLFLCHNRRGGEDQVGHSVAKMAQDW